MSEVERITEDELSYVKELQEQIRMAQFPMQSYGQFLAKRYRLAETDRIEEDGTIVRGQKDENGS